MSTITFNDIEIGDKIRQTRTTSQGAEASCTLTVEYKNHSEVRGQGLKISKIPASSIYKDVKIELLERPEPKEYVVVREESNGRFILASYDIRTLAESERHVSSLMTNPAYCGRKYSVKRLVDMPPPAPVF